MSLSEKIEGCHCDQKNCYCKKVHVKHITLAVARLKENFCQEHHVAHEVNEKIIDEIFGEKLT